MKPRLLPWSISLALLATPWALAQTPSDDDKTPTHPEELERIVVEALPLERTALESAQPIDVLAGERLDDRRGVTLGETLSQQPGVQSSYYGPGSGRPIIRGLGGTRVRVLEDGLSTADAASSSDDHAVTADPLLVDQIEILRGPATLLYGSGASGGVVNLIDNRIPTQVPAEPFTGAYEVRGNTVADETSGVLRLDGGGGQWAWHLDGSWRDSDDYEIPGMAERDVHHGEHGDDHHDEHHDDHHDHDHAGEHHDEHSDEHSDGLLENSFVESQSGTFGLSFIGDRGFVGASVRHYTTDYGIPAPHMHGEEGHEGHADHDEDHDEHGDHDDHDEHGDHDDHDEHGDHDDHDEHDSHGAHGEEEFFAAINMEQTSYDVKAGLMNPLPGFERLTVRMGYNDYHHEEVEMAAGGGSHDHDHGHDHGDDHAHDDGHDHGHSDTMHGTVFDIETTQARFELESQPFAGWVGAFGLQYDDQDFSSVGAEAYVAPNTTESLALFGLQEKTWGDVTVSLGARLEQTEIQADLMHSDGHHDHDEHHDDHHDDHGDEHHDEHDEHHHEAFEFGQDHREFDAFSSSVGAIWRFSSQWQSTLNLSYSERAPSASELFANGPHLATFAFERGSDALDKETSVAWDWGIHRHGAAFDFKANAFYKDIDDFIYWADTDEMLDGFPLRLATQADAKLYGTEVIATWQIHDTSLGDFDLHASHDWVRGKRDGGENLPRISPQRVQLGLDWHSGPWRAGMEWQHMFDQDKTAHAEPETPGYDLVSARLAYRFDKAGGALTAFVQGNNLLDEQARVHTSYLRDYAPLPGRNVTVGLRGEF